jgi:hypothetical protein
MDILCGNMFTMYDQSLNKNFEFEFEFCLFNRNMSFEYIIQLFKYIESKSIFY